MHEEKLRPGYVSYLLRLWETVDGDQHTWRASLETPGQQVRLNFASLTELIAYLEQMVKDRRTHPD